MCYRLTHVLVFLTVENESLTDFIFKDCKNNQFSQFRVECKNCGQLNLLVAYLSSYSVRFMKLIFLYLKTLTVLANWQQIKEIANEAWPSENNVSSGTLIRRLVIKGTLTLTTSGFELFEVIT